MWFPLLALILLKSAWGAGSTIYYTLHSDAQCQSRPHDSHTPTFISADGSRRQLLTSTCLRAPDHYVVYTCTLFRAAYTLYVMKYDATDATCQTPLGPVAKVKHEALCAPDVKSKGGYRLVHCGDDGMALSGVQTSQALVSPQLFQDKACLTATRGQQERHVFGTCIASDYRSKGWWSAKSKFHFILTLVQSTPQLRLRMQTFQAGDATCSQRITSVRDILYAAVPTDPALVRCLPDPLFDGYYYINSLNNAPYFFFNPTAFPTAVPTTSPSPETTDVPTVAATEQPSPRPTPLPTFKPSAVPSALPSAKPTPSRTPAPTMRILTGTLTTLSYSVFSNPQGLSVDAAGVVYFAEYSTSHRIWSISPESGLVSQVGALFSSWAYPWGAAVDGSGNLYVGNTYEHKVKKIDASTGVVTSVGTSASPAFSYPAGTAVDAAGNVFVADNGNSLVRRISTTGAVTTVGPGATDCVGVAVDASGNIYAALRSAKAVMRWAAPGGGTGVSLGKSPEPPFGSLMSVAVDVLGNVYVADATTNAIRRIDGITGDVSTLVASGSPAISAPGGVFCDALGGIYISDSGNGLIRKFEVLGAPTPAPTSVSVARGLVLSLDAATYTTGNWVDSVGGKVFTLYNGPTWSSAGGGSFSFVSSSSQYAETTSALPSMTSWSIEVWHLWSGTYFSATTFSTKGPCIVSNMYASGGDQLNFILGSPAYTPPLIGVGYYDGANLRSSATTTLPTNSWAHIVGTYDGTTASLYVNNILVASTFLGGTTSGGGGTVLMRRWDIQDYWGGLLAKVKIYNVALTAAEVSNNWFADRARFGHSAPPSSAPSLSPSSLPTYLPDVPTPTPSSLPTRVPTATPSSAAARGLVLSLDAATYSGTGNWVDSVGRRAFVPFGTTPPVRSAAAGGSISFVPASGQYFHTSTSLPTMRTWTIEVWYMYSGTYTGGNNPAIVSEVYSGPGNINFALAGSGSGEAIFVGYYTDPSWFTSATTTTPANTWLHIVATFDGATANIYVNNIVKVSTNLGGVSYSGGKGINIMKRWEAEQHMGGSLGIVRIYNVALTAAEVKSNWLAERARFGFGLVLSLDAANYAGAGSNWIDTVGGRSFTAYGTTPPAYSATVGGGSISFVPTQGHYFQSTSALPSMTSWSIEVWHLWSGTYFSATTFSTKGPCIVSNMYASGGNQLNFILGSPAYTPPLIGVGYYDGANLRSSATTTLPTNSWAHIVGTYDGTTASLYVNNIQVASTFLGGTTSGGGGTVLMRRWDIQDYWGGLLAKVKIYNVALTAAEVSNNWFADRARFGQFSSPTLAPSFLPGVPTPMPTLAPGGATTRGLVLSLDAATLSAGATTWVDSKGGRSFTLYGGPTWSSAAGGSISFVPASSQYAQTLSALPSMTAFTIEVWFQWSGLSTGSQPAIVADIYSGTPGKSNFALGGTSLSPKISVGYSPTTGGWPGTPPVSIASGTWLHIVGTVDSAAANLYINNVLVSTASMAGEGPSSPNIGLNLCRRWDSGEYFGGSLAKVKIYNVALTASEVSANWYADRARFGFGLVLSLDAANYAGTGNWIDSISGRAFVPYGTTPPVRSAAAGGSISFVPASGQKFQSTTALPTLKSWTIEVWVLSSGVYTGSYPTIVTDVYGSAPNAVNFMLGYPYSATSLQMGYCCDWMVSSSTTIPSGTWLHIVASFDGTYSSLFINNRLLFTNTMAGSPVSGNTGISIFGKWSNVDYFGGSLAKVKIYNVALTAAEVSANWFADRARFGLGLVLSLDAANYAGAGSWVDSIGGRSFVPYGTTPPAYSATVGGGSISFVPAQGHYFQSTTPLPSLSTWTIEVWHYYTATFSPNSGGVSIVSDIVLAGNAYYNFALGWQAIGGPPLLSYYSYSLYKSSTFTLAANNWYHICGTFDGTVGNVYVNNILVVSTQMAGRSASGNVGIRLMARWDNLELWGGLLSKVNIYNTPLSASDVSNNWNADKARFGL